MTPARERKEGRERLRPWVDRAKGFSGWSFDDIRTKDLGPPCPWQYAARASSLLTASSSVLDMGTGGGELFGRLCAGLPGRAAATEEWSTNVPVAARRLGPMGVRVVRCRSVSLPFRDSAFDLVLNRHEELDPAEVARVLAPGGVVLTQQVGGREWRELRGFFPRMADAGPLFERYRAGFQDAGLEVTDSRTHTGRVEYPGLGEVVYMLAVAPWKIPGFDPLGRDLDRLLKFERARRTGRGIALTEERFLLEARKPPSQR